MIDTIIHDFLSFLLYLLPLPGQVDQGKTREPGPTFLRQVACIKQESGSGRESIWKLNKFWELGIQYWSQKSISESRSCDLKGVEDLKLSTEVGCG